MFESLFNVFVGVDFFSELFIIFFNIFIRWNLESIGTLDPRKSALEEDFEEEEEKEENEQLDGMEDDAHEKVFIHVFSVRWTS